jgi:hypothetical protein
VRSIFDGRDGVAVDYEILGVQMTPKTMQKITNAIFFLAIVNWVVFVVIALSIGGDALNGKIEAGHYYLREHGRYTEVSAAVFQYSRIHALSLFVTHPLAMVAAIWRYRTQERQNGASSTAV